MPLNGRVNETAAHQDAMRARARKAARESHTIATMVRGYGAVVRFVPPEHESSLARVGIGPGTSLAVESQAPFGGPIVVRVGHARIALGRSVAAGVRVEPVGS